MISVAITVLAVFLILVGTEYLHKKKKIRGESARKLVHIAVGSFVATWPFYLDVTTIELLCLAFVGGVLLVRYSGFFGSIHDVERKTWGDVLFPLGIALTAMIAAEPWIFSAAMLHLGLADGVAALIGMGYKKARFYKIFGQRKSVVGTLCFLIVSFMITLVMVMTQQQALAHVGLPLLLWLPPLITVIENIAPNGTDNIFVPLTVTLLLNALIFPV